MSTRPDRFLRACHRQPTDCTPVWFMRQAGRYLPEYRTLRERYDILTICRTPELAVEATLQPLKRFQVDAAILFADIMLPLAGMGVAFKIVEDIGPVIEHPIKAHSDVKALRVTDPEEAIPYVLETIRLLRQELGGMVPLIGFSGAPFTLASYLIEGQASRSLIQTKRFLYNELEGWRALMEVLTQVVLEYLRAQIHAGAQAVQLFDSWVGVLSPRDYQEFVLPYTKRIFADLKEMGVPRIHFGTETTALLELMRRADSEVIGIDWRLPLNQAWPLIGTDKAIQGNLDPATLLGPFERVEVQARAILQQAANRPGHIFNLGHGVLPQTPVEHLQRLVDLIHRESER